MAIKRLDHINFITHDPEKTIYFFCQIIGLEIGAPLSIDTSQSLYFHIPGQKTSILHIGNAKSEQDQPRFKRLAELDSQHDGNFSTGSLDHFCLAVDFQDYDGFIKKLEHEQIPYITYCHEDTPMKQIWLLDPNGVRIELNFV